MFLNFFQNFDMDKKVVFDIAAILAVVVTATATATATGPTTGFASFPRKVDLTASQAPREVFMQTNDSMCQASHYIHLYTFSKILSSSVHGGLVFKVKNKIQEVYISLQNVEIHLLSLTSVIDILYNKSLS